MVRLHCSSTTVVLPSSPRKSSKGPGLKARKFALFQGAEAPCSLRNRGSTTVVLEQFRNTRRLFEDIPRWRFLEENATSECAFGLYQFRNCCSACLRC